MSNAIALNNDDLGLATRQDDSIFSELTIQGNWLPRVQLYSSKSKVVELGKIDANHWGIVKGKDKLDDLGATFNAVPLAYRPMALDLTGKKAVSHHDPASSAFKTCVEKSDVKDSQMMAGIQFLLYIQNVGFATLFCASKSARMMAPAIRKLIRTYVTFGSHTVESGKWVFRAPNVVESNVQFELAPVEELKKKITEFTTQTASTETDKDMEGETQAAPGGVDESGRVR